VLPGQLCPERLGLTAQGSEAGPALEQLVDLPPERPGACQVAEREVDAGQFDSGLNREVGQRVSGLPRVFRTPELVLFHAASCRFRYSLRASCGVRYPSAE
jgi:hypothetical protein